MDFFKRHKNALSVVAPVLGIAGIMYVFQCLKLPLMITNIFFVSASLLYMTHWWKKNAENKWELIIIWVAFAARILVCLLDIYASDLIEIPFTGGDSIAYLRVSESIYHGKPEKFYTYYPYVINAIYQVAGLNRFAAQFVNILCWCVCTVIIQKSCKLLEIKKELRMLAIFLYSFMPINLIFNSILLREAIPATGILFLFYSILKWMKDGKYLSLIVGFVVSAPAFILHNSMVGIWFILALVLVFYSPAKQRFCIEKKSIYAILLGIVGVAMFIIVLATGIIHVQIPDFSKGLINALNTRLKSFYTNYGGSTYLMNEYVYDYPSVVTGTIKRMLYFYCSPVPFMWRGISDIIAFFGSTIVYIISALISIVSLFYKKRDSYRFTISLTVFVICGIFSWMVSNGGTAMRHREKFLGIVVLLGVYSVKLIKENWNKK